MATTPEAIRARMAALLKTATPALHSAHKFVEHEEVTDFREWCLANPGSCLRRFSIDPAGDTTQALVTSTTLERVESSMTVTVAYPKDFRHGGRQLAGLKDAISKDEVKVEATIGVSASDATLKSLASIFRTADVQRDMSPGEPVVFLVIPYRVEYARSLA